MVFSRLFDWLATVLNCSWSKKGRELERKGIRLASSFSAGCLIEQLQYLCAASLKLSVPGRTEREIGRRGSWLASLMVIDPGVSRWIGIKEEGGERLGEQLACPLLYSLIPSWIIQRVEQKGRDIWSGERETGFGWDLSFSSDYLLIFLTISQPVGREKGGVEGWRIGSTAW